MSEKLGTQFSEGICTLNMLQSIIRLSSTIIGIISFQLIVVMILYTRMLAIHATVGFYNTLQLTF
jgi:hypothetical protein